MRQTVWQNHDRHAKHEGRTPDCVEQEEAEAVLFLSVALVQWFKGGLVRRA